MSSFVLKEPHGVVVGCYAPETEEAALAELDKLLPEERALAESLGVARRLGFALGRRAIHRALKELGVDSDGPILSAARGAPRLPDSVLGSISHKEMRLRDEPEVVAVAIASLPEPGLVGVGVDVEAIHPARPKVTRLVLSPKERELIADVPEAERWAVVVSKFSIKESIYKALAPTLDRFIGFEEATVALEAPVTWTEAGVDVGVEMELKKGEAFDIEARLSLSPWPDAILTTVRARQPSS